MKVTGLELQKFINDIIKNLPEFYYWPIEDNINIIIFNNNTLNIKSEFYSKPLDLKKLPDIKFNGSSDQGKGYSFLSAFKKWKKNQTTSYIIISCPTNYIEDIKLSLTGWIKDFKNTKII